MSKYKIRHEDVIIACLIISTLAFHDQTKWMVIFQVLGFVYEVIRHRFKIPKSATLMRYVWWEGFFVAFALSSYLWSLHRDTVISCTISICQVTMTGLTLILYTDGKPEKIDKIISYIILACVVLVFRLVVTVPVDAWGGKKRIGQYLGSGKSGGYGNTGLTYVLSMGAIFAIYRGKEQKAKIYYLLFVIITVFSLLSGSKKAIVILAATVGLLAVLSSKNAVRIIAAVIGSLMVIILAWILVMNVDVLYNAVGYRIELFLNFFTGGKTDGSTLTRWTYLIQAFEMFMEYPLAGVGLDGFRYFNKRTAWAENNLFELMADLGIIGTVLYYRFVVRNIAFAVHQYRRNRKELRYSIILIAFACLMFIDMTMVSYMNDFLQFYLVVVYLLLHQLEAKVSYPLLKERKV